MDGVTFARNGAAISFVVAIFGECMTEPAHIERRAAQRFDFHLPVSVRKSGGDAEGSGFTQDISARGAFFYTEFQLDGGENVELTLVMPSEITLAENMKVRCKGKVVRVVKPATGNKLGIAVHLEGYEFLPDSVSREAASPEFTRVSTLHPHPQKERPARSNLRSGIERN